MDPNPAQRVDIIEEIRHDSKGAVILAEWLGNGGQPVAKGIAWRRADLCLTCPKNKPGNWWDKVKDRIADAIRDHLEVKRKLELETPYDKDIGTCEACGCNLPLAVWVPIKHVLNHTSEKELAAFEAICWKRNEKP